jgi:hypothetical protein
MAAQPLNSDISVFYNVRSYRPMRKGSSVAAGIYRLRPLVTAVPGIDNRDSEVKTRDTTRKDFSPYAEAGFPATYGLHGDLSFEDTVAHVAGAGLSFKIGQDRFLPQAADALDEDFYGKVRTVETTYVQTPDV